MLKKNYQTLAVSVYDRLKQGETLPEILSAFAHADYAEGFEAAMESVALHFQEASDKLAVQMDSLGEERATPWIRVHETLEDTAEEIRQFALTQEG